MATVRNKPVQKIEPSKVMSRKEIAETLKKAVISYYAHKNYSVYIEFGIIPDGKRMLDCFVLNMKGETIGVEIKSCKIDYEKDLKWRDYLPYTNKFYFCISQKLYDQHGEKIKEDTKELGVGIMVLTIYGHIQVVQNAKKKKVDKKERKRILIKAAWRGGESKRIHKRRTRHYIT